MPVHLPDVRHDLKWTGRPSARPLEAFDTPEVRLPECLKPLHRKRFVNPTSAAGNVRDARRRDAMIYVRPPERVTPPKTKHSPIWRRVESHEPAQRRCRPHPNRRKRSRRSEMSWKALGSTPRTCHSTENGSSTSPPPLEAFPIFGEVSNHMRSDLLNVPLHRLQYPHGQPSQCLAVRTDIYKFISVSAAATLTIEFGTVSSIAVRQEKLLQGLMNDITRLTSRAQPLNPNIVEVVDASNKSTHNLGVLSIERLLNRNSTSQPNQTHVPSHAAPLPAPTTYTDDNAALSMGTMGVGILEAVASHQNSLDPTFRTTFTPPKTAGES
ncbi:hypothetical protein M407DRAFT_33095 [Tulasnella calospora MUT 4182]|uniref:Uncharacterized protein n=1 Tax=Tulasnella calospora MUT 4182 TaxID=1051891 RepID=A0A0C3Q3M1_9AGAM|nr:hypothetical protein M407DRAFT_33095 [Tulasnella calospora MUT 4182]